MKDNGGQSNILKVIKNYRGGSLSMIYNNYKKFRCNLGKGRAGKGKMTENLFYKTA